MDSGNHSERVDSWVWQLESLEVLAAQAREILQPKWVSESLREQHAIARESSAISFVFTISVANSQKTDHFHIGRRANSVANFLVFEAFHQGGVVAERFSHQHHGRERDHDLAVQPHGQVFVLAEIVEDQFSGLARFRWVCVPMLGADADHFIEITLAPSIGITQGNDYHRRLLDFRLIMRSGAEPSANLWIAHHDEPPGLEVIAAG